MNPMAIIQKAKQDGITIALSATGSIRATGSNKAMARWLPIFRQKKSVLVLALLEEERQHIMRVMNDWHTRTAMMLCSNLTTEQARQTAWRDLRLDEVFFGMRAMH